jgi:hypothetical protein
MRTKLTATTAVLAMCAAPLALAQTQPTQQSGSGIPSLVTVDLRNVLNDLAVRLNLDRANVPVTAQIPITVAANVCGVSVNVLAASTGGQAACQAKTGGVQLAQAVQQQMAAGGSVAGSQGGTASGTGTGTAVGSLGGTTGATSTGGTTSTGQGSPTTQTAGAPASTGATAGTQTAQTGTGGTAPRQPAPTATGAGPQTQAAQPGAGTPAPPRTTASMGTPANSGATIASHGASQSAPGHVKKRHHQKSALAYAPGQQPQH